MQQPAQQRQPDDQPDTGVAAVAQLVSRVDGCRIGLGGGGSRPVPKQESATGIHSFNPELSVDGR